MKLGYTILYVPNVSKTLSFYEKAFGCKIKFQHEGGDYGELDTGNTTLAFVSFDLAESHKTGFDRNKRGSHCNDMEIAFTSDNVEKDYERALQAGAIAVSKPHPQPWGQVISYVRDLNGFLVEICSPVG